MSLLASSHKHPVHSHTDTVNTAVTPQHLYIWMYVAAIP